MLHLEQIMKFRQNNEIPKNNFKCLTETLMQFSNEKKNQTLECTNFASTLLINFKVDRIIFHKPICKVFVVDYVAKKTSAIHRTTYVKILLQIRVHLRKEAAAKGGRTKRKENEDYTIR